MTSVEDPNIGRCIGGDFQVGRLIAAGGVGSVYEAVQQSTGKLRALKLMHAWLLRDEKMRSRFVDEARIAGSIESDHVVEIVSAGIDADMGIPWMAMELLRGRTLAEHVERYGSMSLPDCLEILVQARHGLQMAHARHLVHRDIKPENIFVADARRIGVPFTVKILDFGIAKWVHDARDLDKNSQVIGTPSWMAPEQLSNISQIAPSTDVWALGLLAFWLLTGREYWIAANDPHGTVTSVLIELVSGVRVPASERAAQLGASSPLPAAFDAWFACALDLDATRRFADAASCIDALAAILQGTGGANEPTRDAGFAGLPPGAPVGNFDTRELDASLDAALAWRTAPRSNPSALAATAAYLPNAAARSALATSATVAPTPSVPLAIHRTARRLEPTDLCGDLFADVATTGGFIPLANLLTIGLSASHPSTAKSESSATDTATRNMPDRVQESIRHVCLVLGVHPVVSAVATADERDTFGVASIAPAVLAVPVQLRELTNTARLRAYAAVGVVQTLSPFALLTLLDSSESLESATKAAVALARGAVSSSPYFRRMVGQLGPHRVELGQACEQAESVVATSFWSSMVLTTATLALLCSADRDAAIEATSAAHLGVDADLIAAHLDAFIVSPSYDTYWHRPAT